MRRSEIEIERDRYVGIAEVRLTRLFTPDTQLETWLRAGFAFGVADPHADAREQLLRRAQMISAATFEALICAGETYSPMFVHEMWDALVRAQVFVRQFRDGRGEAMLADHQIDLRLLLEHLRDGTFANLFYPPGHLYDRYSPAIVAVDVTLASGDSARGSGFVASTDDTGRRWMFTCLHNVDPAAVTLEAVTSATGRKIEMGEPMLSDRNDMAVFPVVTDILSTPLVLRAGGGVFDEVYSLGFPAVPRSESVLLGHRGEINAKVDVVFDKHPALIISNLVSPGSSGGPVLDRSGRCLGMSIKWLEAEWSGEKARFSAALPADTMLEEFKRLVESP